MITQLRQQQFTRFIALLLALALAEPVLAKGSDGSAVEEESGSGWELPLQPLPGQREDAKKTSPETAPSHWNVEESGLGQGFVAVEVDSLPAEVYLDGERHLFESSGRVLPVRQGRHFVSFFPVDKVYLAFRDEVPVSFWEELRPGIVQKGAFGLMASYERGPVQAGTVWLSVTPDDTTPVALSRARVRRTYRQESFAAVVTFFSVTTAIGAAMLASVAAIRREQ